MAGKTLIDAGPLVAYLWPKDAYHAWSVAQFQRFQNFTTCDAVLSEACARLGYFGLDQSKVIRLVETGCVTVDFNTNAAASRIVRLMEKYRDQPMDFADACLVVVSEDHPDSTIVTLDSTDFSIYRRLDRKTVPFISP